MIQFPRFFACLAHDRIGESSFVIGLFCVSARAATAAAACPTLLPLVVIASFAGARALVQVRWFAPPRRCRRTIESSFYTQHILEQLFFVTVCVYYFIIHVQIQLHFMSAAAAAHGKVPFFDLPLSPSRAVRRIYFVYMTIWQPTCGRIKKKKTNLNNKNFAGFSNKNKIVLYGFHFVDHHHY